MPFRKVNARGTLGHDPALQRHHLLPRQLLSRRCFGPLFDAIGTPRIGFEDFRTNGMLLPCRSEAVFRLGVPLHRGPHRQYNILVIERVGQIESDWVRRRRTEPDLAVGDAIMRLKLLQKALRKRLLAAKIRPFKLNRKDPLGKGFNFADLDAMAAQLWAATGTGPRR